MTARHWIHTLRLPTLKKRRSPALMGCPHKKAVVIKSFDTTPRKPNSAKRKTAKVRLSNRKYIRVYFEGIGFNRLQPHSVVLVRGSGPRDLPGVRYHTVRGKFDLPALLNYKKARSKYGVKRQTKKEKIIPLTSLDIVYRELLKKQRQRFLTYKHTARSIKKYRRAYFLLKSKLPN